MAEAGARADRTSEFGPGVIVLGMHRSGTSAVTQALGMLGLEPGRDEALMGAGPSNESGHWEITALTECNDRLLREGGGRWSGPPANDGVFTDAGLAHFCDEARVLTADLLPAEPWAWKDPRLCLTLPFWQSVLATRPAMVVCLRHPLEVAASLARRNGFAVPYGLALWERYQRSLWRHLEGAPALVVDFGALVSDPGWMIGELAAFVERHTGVTADDAARAEAVGSLDRDKRHHEVDASDLAADPSVSTEQRRLLEQSLAMVGTHETFPHVALGPETSGLQLAFDEHSRMAAYEDESYRLRAGLDEARAGLDRQTLFFHQELERRSAEASLLATDVMAARGQVAALQATIDRVRGRLPVRAYLAMRRRLSGRGG